MLKRLRRRAMVRGPFGGSREWTLLWAALLGVRLIRRLTHKEPEVVFCETLKAGDSLVISGLGREPRVIGGETTGH